MVRLIQSICSVKFVFTIGICVAMLCATFVLAHIVTLPSGASTQSVNVSVPTIYNISVNITYPGQAGNVTEVNITLASGMLLLTNTANMSGSGLAHDVNISFVNTSTVLSWRNSTLLINGSGGLAYFWFNATASTPATTGVLNLTITITNLTGSVQSITTLTVNDTIRPNATYVSPTNSSGAAVQNFTINVTGLDNGAISNITIYLYNLTHSLLRQNSSATSPNNVTYIDLPDGIYLFNATVYDTSFNFNPLNFNMTATRNVTVDNYVDSVDFASPTNTSGIYTRNQNFTVNVTSTETLGVLNITNITIYLSNASTLLRSNVTNNYSANISYVSLPDGIYFFNATVVNANNKTNSTGTRNITVDTTAPGVELDLGDGTTTTVNVSISITEATSGINVSCTVDSSSAVVSGTSVTQTLFESGLSCGTSHSYTVTCIDRAGNSGSDTKSVSTDSCTSAGSGTGSTGSSAGVTTFAPSSSQLSSGYNKELYVNEQVQMNVGGATHKVLVQTVSGNTIAIQVSSTPQAATLTSGETKKFEVTGDNYYDVSVKLNSVSGTKANVTVMTINEQMPAAQNTAPVGQPATTNTTANQPPTVQDSSEGRSNLWKWIVGLIVILIIVGIILAVVQGKSKRK